MQEFLSTLSLRRATSPPDFRYLDNIISIHALLAESDCSGSQQPAGTTNFYPRSPCGERPANQTNLPGKISISIHALLAESDHISKARGKQIDRFLSTLSLRRATRAERHASSQQEFLSTLSLRRATARRAPRQQPAGISIHALLAESDNLQPGYCAFIHYFYPRSPCGERRDVIAVMTEAQSISIHALLAESDTDGLFFFGSQNYFYPRSPCGERPSNRREEQEQRDFYPRSPCGERQRT